eukprot:m.269165 g.269165  ORF g.269165 m.269165 type:complete len:148 (-) comp40633_c0_seq1:58-501(-)
MPSDEDIKITFELFGTDKKKKKIKAESIAEVVRYFGFITTDKRIQQEIEAAGVKGEADLKQVTTIVKALESTKDAELLKTIKTNMKTFDPHDSDTVVVSELKHVLSTMGEKLSATELDEIFRLADVDGFGQVEINSFAEMLVQNSSK